MCREEGSGKSWYLGWTRTCAENSTQRTQQQTTSTTMANLQGTSQQGPLHFTLLPVDFPLITRLTTLNEKPLGDSRATTRPHDMSPCTFLSFQIPLSIFAVPLTDSPSHYELQFCIAIETPRVLCVT